MELKIGSVVYSKAGHDAGDAYVVVVTDAQKGYVKICDGKSRPLARPKLKNPKHLIYKGENVSIEEQLTTGVLKDSDLIYYLNNIGRDIRV